MIHTLLTVYVFYLPVYLMLLFFLTTRMAGYTVRSHVISMLATANQPWSSVFNRSTTLCGVLSLALPAGIAQSLGINTLHMAGAFFLVTTGVSIALVGVFPMHTQQRRHSVVTILAFFGMLMSGITFALILQEAAFPLALQVLNLGVIVTTLLLVVATLRMKKPHSSLEWLAVTGSIGWNFLMTLWLLTAGALK